MPQYIDNAVFYSAMVKFNDEFKTAQKQGLDNPRVSEYIGKCLLDISTNLSLRREFVGYSFRDDMIQDGCENCLTYINNYDPKKSKNPFAYFTQIIYFAFLRRIGKELKQSYIKAKAQERYLIFMDEVEQAGEDKMDNHNNYEIIAKFENAKERKKLKRVKPETKAKVSKTPKKTATKTTKRKIKK